MADGNSDWRFSDMANLLITWRCNRHCTYCFARDRVGSGQILEGFPPQSGNEIDLERLDAVIAFVKRSKASDVGLLGGEPGLHPALAPMVERLLEAGLNVRLFTGGLIPETVARFLADTDPERVRIVINIPGPGDLGSETDATTFGQTLQMLAGRGTLGYTIRDAAQDLRFLAELADTYRMKTHPMRLGLASPCIDDPSPPMLPVSSYPRVAQRILELGEACARRQVAVEFDCGFPRCMFGDAEHEQLRMMNVHTVFACCPVIDIGPDLKVWSCFPLKALGEVGLDDAQTRGELVTRFARQQRAYRNLGVYNHCMDCPHKHSGACAGGCLAHVIRSFSP